jgi:hypothetical protein
MSKNLKRRELEKDLEAVEKSVPVNNMGKWAKQVRIDSLITKIKKLTTKRKDKTTPKKDSSDWDDNTFHTEADF